MNTFSCRIECPRDIEVFFNICAENELTVNVVTMKQWIDERGIAYPDHDVEFVADASKEEILDMMREVEDGYVMMQSLRECPLSENSLKRDYDQN